MRLKDRVAIITGGARGIGKATAEIFSKEGAITLIWDLIDEGETTAKELQAKGFPAAFYSVNVSDPKEVREAVEQIVSQYGRIDILINNAGIIRDKSFLKMSHHEWESVLNVNLTGVFNCTKAVAPVMKEAGYGRIVTTSSIVGITGAFGQANYSATKGGIIAMTKTLAKELGRYGITANAVAPGFVKTAMTDSIPEEVRQAGINQIPVKRIGMPEDIAYGYLYLASEEASFVNGHTLSINGGVL